MVSLLLSTVACAQTPVFTTLGSSGKTIFAGVKKELKGQEPETYLLEVSSEKLSSQKVTLPVELIHREVVALFSSDKNQLLVMTQRTVEQGDKPLLHSYNILTKTWKKVGEADCPSFAKLSVQKDSITLSCVETNAAGDEVVIPKKITLKEIQLSPVGEITLPLEKVNQGNIQAELLGESFQWKELKVGVDKKQKVFRP